MNLSELVGQYDFAKEFFKAVGYDGLERCQLRTYKPKERLCHKAEPVYECHLILEGRLSVINHFQNGKDFIYVRVGPRNVIGEMEIAAEEACYMSTVECVTCCKTIMWTKEIELYWLEKYAPFARAAATRLAKMICISASKNGTSLAHTAEELLTLLLIDAYLGENHDGILSLTDTRETMSSRMGVSLRTLYRTVNLFESKNMLELKEGKIYLHPHHYQALRDYAKPFFS